MQNGSQEALLSWFPLFHIGKHLLLLLLRGGSFNLELCETICLKTTTRDYNSLKQIKGCLLCSTKEEGVRQTIQNSLVNNNKSEGREGNYHPKRDFD